jgi:hypothetical protein
MGVPVGRILRFLATVAISGKGNWQFGQSWQILAIR